VIASGAMALDQLVDDSHKLYANLFNPGGHLPPYFEMSCARVLVEVADGLIGDGAVAMAS